MPTGTVVPFASDTALCRVPVTALIAWPRFDSQDGTTGRQRDGSTGLNRERPTCTERNESLLESADGSLATAATRRETKTLFNEASEESTRLDSDRPSHGSALET